MKNLIKTPLFICLFLFSNMLHASIVYMTSPKDIYLFYPFEGKFYIKACKKYSLVDKIEDCVARTVKPYFKKIEIKVLYTDLKELLKKPLVFNAINRKSVSSFINGGDFAKMQKLLEDNATLMTLTNSIKGTEVLFELLGLYLDGTPTVANKKMEFVRVPSGSFRMGSSWLERGRDSSTEKSHNVTISSHFDISKTEVTQLEWFQVMGNNPSFFKLPQNCTNHKNFAGVDICPEHPVESVTWTDVQTFIGKLNASQPTYKYSLPSEVQWEYAARAGARSAFFWGSSPSDIDRYVWHAANSRSHTQLVSKKAMNSFKLYDMLGNVEEWVQDIFKADYNTASNTYTCRTLRGGSYLSITKNLRSAARRCLRPTEKKKNIGFRLIRK
jgi:formylglycine-generating enzyme required for sulfatase activity